MFLWYYLAKVDGFDFCCKSCEFHPIDRKNMWACARTHMHTYYTQLHTHIHTHTQTVNSFIFREVLLYCTNPGVHILHMHSLYRHQSLLDWSTILHTLTTHSCQQIEASLPAGGEKSTRNQTLNNSQKTISMCHCSYGGGFPSATSMITYERALLV